MPGKRINTTTACSILWLRNDLRLHDHQALLEAAAASQLLIPLFVMDNGTAYPGERPDGAGMGAERFRFLAASLAELRRGLQALGSDLVVRPGDALQVISGLCAQYPVTAICYNREPGYYETVAEAALQQYALAAGIRIHIYEGGFLLSEGSLPFAPAQVPDVYTQFRKAVELRLLQVAALDAPAALPPLPQGLEPGIIPAPGQAGVSQAPGSFAGGEAAGLQRLKNYITGSQAIAHYYDTRNELSGELSASHLSPWLANGSLSPRRVLATLRAYEQAHGGSQSSSWFFQELLWREYFRYSMLRHGRHYFRYKGIHNKGLIVPPAGNGGLERWMAGDTPSPFVNALMTELRITGFLSNRGRQIAASYLVYDLQGSWLAGAAHFERLLIDYDVSSNYGNWAYIAGAGCDPRGGRHFDVQRQASLYDSRQQYTRFWLQLK